jgi:hypothetical protein
MQRMSAAALGIHGNSKDEALTRYILSTPKTASSTTNMSHYFIAHFS